MKPYFRYQMDFDGKWIRWSTICMAASFFAGMVYYFGITNLAECGFGEILFLMILPALLSGGYVFLMKIRQLNAPGIYGILGAVLCLCTLIGCFYSGNAIRIILGIVWYLLCGGAILACVGGYLPGNTPVTAAFGIAIAVRLLFFPVRGLNLGLWVKELSTLLSLTALMMLTLGLKSGRTKN